MACTNCQDNNSSNVKVFSVQYIYDTNCTDCNSQCNGTITDAKCVVYAGPNLTCSQIATNDSLELALQKIDTILCSTAGDYSSYNIHCLTGPITTEAAFVDAITAYVCNLTTTLTTFTGTTFPNYQTAVNTRFVALEKPGNVCTSVGTLNTDTLQQALTKYCTKFTAIDANLDLSGVDWSQCFTVNMPPTTVHGGFDTLIDQICSVKALITDSSLPTFNNTGSCLASPGSSDSLVDTISKIKTRLCLTPTFTNASLSSSCISIPSGVTDIQTLVQTILTKLDTLTQNLPTYSSDFAVTNVNDSNLCLGKHIALATPIDQDRYVAVNDSDSSPGTLVDKLAEGPNITLTVVGDQLQIAAAGGNGDHKVLASSSDDTADYLNNKVEGDSDSNGLTIDTNYDSETKKVKITPSLDLSTLIPAIRVYLSSNPTEKALWCQLFADCPSPCSQPQNVQAVYISGSITTTTTTSTTTTTTTTTAAP